MERLSDIGRWASIEEISDVCLCPSDMLGAIRDFLREHDTGSVPPFRQPWERYGWYSHVMAWIEDQLQSLGINIVEKPSLVKWWSLSSVLKVATTCGDLYFKSSAQQPLFVNEPRLLTYLSSLYPDHVPTVIASDPRSDWMLTKAFGAKLGKDAPIEQKKEALRVFSGLQLDSIGHIESLLRVGCADRRPHRLIPLIDPLLGDELVVSKLTMEETQELRTQVPLIKEMCSKLLEYSVPATLVHGDLHLGNVAMDNDTLIFFDWTDACIAHPFMDMLPIYNEGDPEVRIQLRDEYLKRWTDFEPMERLLELWSLCEVAHAVHHAISYQSILRNTEEKSRGELGGAPAFQLRKALQKLSNVLS